ncbi:PqiC family protein [Candidatus Thiothrix anitrata]|uniref:Membrane integrity-associated transporter subunit PqiC n=1 Tax=Candidatus Thiothrix anitrata TaxID=2823902 RepID=A0ABX7WZR5_9GAMM|nr:PqiC family protein [Candidatus Thiothrix anitrata]QTR49159.1 membrane integrity-associated transporter subunit PqiC [Candidatus Thiothrix anitrata]
MFNRISVFLCLAFLSACSSTPTQYHTLSMNVASAAAVVMTNPINSVGVGPITLPTLLDREGMVIRKDATTLEVSDTHLWGGQLEDEFLRTLAQHLQVRLPATRVQTVPWELSQTPQYQVVVKLDQFDGILGGKAWLRGVWQLQAGGDGEILATESVVLTRQTPQAGVTGLVKAQSGLLADLANQIAQDLAAR